MRHLLKCIALILMGLWTCLGAAALAADVPPAPAANADQPPPPLAAVSMAESSADVEAGGAVRPADDILGDLVSLDFRDADLQDVLRLITKKSGLNVIMNPADVRGKVTLRLENVRLGVALDEILRVNGLARLPRTENNIVRIVTAKAAGIPEVETITEVIPINFADAGNVANLLKGFLTDGVGKIVADGGTGGGGGGAAAGAAGGAAGGGGAASSSSGGTNSIIVTDTPTQVEMIKNEILPKIDKQQLQVLIEMRLVEMTEGAVRELGSQLNLSRPDNNSPVGALSKFVPATPGQPALFGPDGVTVIRPAIPAVPAHFIDAAAGNAPIGADGSTHVFPQDELKSVTDAVALADPQLAFGEKLAIFGKDFNLSALFHLKEERDDVEILAQPRVVTLNGGAAHIEIIRQIPYIKEISAETGTTGGGQQTLKVDFLQEGIKIDTTPFITPNGYVRMTLTSDQNIESGLSSLGGQSTPIIDERKATAGILVRSEETAMLGGLRQFTQTRTITGIPWFHRIPVLGWLFKSNNTNQQKNDLYLFVTPTILEHPELSVDEKGLYDRIDRKAGLPDYYMDDTSAPGDLMD